MRIGILTDFPTRSTLSGPAIQAEVLKEGLVARGHEVVLLGPDTRSARPLEPGQETFLFRGISHPAHPGVKVSLPASPRRMRHPPRLDVVLAQTTNPMACYANWIRRMWRVPVLHTHTIHLPTHAHHLLPGVLARMAVPRRLSGRLGRVGERSFVRLYNAGDTLVVQSPHLIDYWRTRGVTVPIEVLERPIYGPAFDRPAGRDPFPATASQGARLLVVCRHDREKSLDQLIRIFDERVAAQAPQATLTLLGTGAAHDELKAQAARSRSAHRIFLPGEVEFDELVDWYRNADLFGYTSVSETFGNVVNEAMYCGLPVVAFDDGMGVAHLVKDGWSGRLVDPASRSAEADWGQACLALLADSQLRRTYGARGAAAAAERSRLEHVLERLEVLMERARQHCRATVVPPLSALPPARQERSLRSCLRWWRFWNSLFIGVSYAANLDRLPAVLSRPWLMEAGRRATKGDHAPPARRRSGHR